MVEERGTAELAKLPLLERLAPRIVDGERNGLDVDVDEAMTQKSPLAIIVENDLAEVYEGEVHYARDAFEGLKLMNVIMSAKRGEAPDVDSPEAVAAREKEAERKARHERSKRIAAERKAKETPVEIPERSVEEYFKLGYRGARFSFGYGACPTLDDRAKMMELLARSCCTTPRPKYFNV